MSEEDSAEATIVTGLLHLLEPVTVEYDQRIRAVQLAQAELADRIDVLTKQITDCVAETEFVDVSPYLQKLVNSRKKIMNVATTLNTISERLARMNRQAQNKYPEMSKLRQSRLEKQKQLESPQTPVQTTVENTPTLPEQPQTQQAEQE